MGIEFLQQFDCLRYAWPFYIFDMNQSPLVGVAVLEGKTGLSEGSCWVNWDGRSGACQPSALEVKRGQRPE